MFSDINTRLNNVASDEYTYNILIDGLCNNGCVIKAMEVLHALKKGKRRFCSNLGMTNQAVKAAQEAVQKSEELDIRRSPISVAAAIIYMITQLSDDKKLLKGFKV
ncbi:hypothetical protein Ddye_022953 [Dipteronia dyeriana]|uniref:Transcription factor TFIIB cyclin-like domain-containing protein n=1 Tax=Dipteronia dyeriana TaxID=168575 RepID=A0AAD9WSX7_9ROSI|nr:hypothetical protein Ddye_022953 [Dipteronia dyeriana]